MAVFDDVKKPKVWGEIEHDITIAFKASFYQLHLATPDLQVEQQEAVAGKTPPRARALSPHLKFHPYMVAGAQGDTVRNKCCKQKIEIRSPLLYITYIYYRNV